jgi:hypothetical protein
VSLAIIGLRITFEASGDGCFPFTAVAFAVRV